MTRDDFEMWKHSPTGKWFFETVLKEQVQVLMESLANGSCQSDFADKVAMFYMERVGLISGIEFVRNLDPFEDSNEIESNRSASPD